MKILGPRLINNDKYLLYIEDTAMDPSRKRKLLSAPSPQSSSIADDNDKTTDVQTTTSEITDDPSSRKPGKRRRKEKVVETMLGEDYEPSPGDCICGRGKEAASHPGNIYFREMIDSYLDEYRRSETKKEKTTIVCNIIDGVRLASPKGKFVRKHNDGRWYDTGDDFAREKIGQCFRDRLHTEYRSSSKAKISRRKVNTDQRPAKPIDFDEYVASPDLASQDALHLVTPSAGLQQNARHGTEWSVDQATGDMPPPSGGDFPVPVRRRTNFQGLTDMYFGDSSGRRTTFMDRPYSLGARTDRQQNMDLLGSLTHSSRDSSRTYQSVMNASANMMEQSLRGHERMSHHPHFEFDGDLSNDSNPEMMYTLGNTNSFVSLPTNAFMTDRSHAFGVAENIPVRDSLMDQTQRVSASPMASMGYRRMGGGTGMDGTAMGALKDFAYMHRDASWHSRAECKPPPMAPSMFEASSSPKAAPPGGIVNVDQAPPIDSPKGSPEGLDSLGESSRIPDDEPLPLD